MLLRSSSTPILGSLILHSDNNRENVGKANSLTENANRFGFRGTNSHTHLYSNYDTCSAEEVKKVNSVSNIRRVQSDGSLENLIGSGCPVDTLLQCDSFDDFNLISANKPWPRRLSAHKRLSSLKSIASLSCYYKEEDEFNQDEILENSADALESSMHEFSFGNEQMRESNMKGFAISGNEQDMVSAKPMFMARGLGIDIIEPSTDVGGGYGNSTPKETSLGGSSGGDGYGAGSENIEDYYQKILEGNPANSLILRNYAQYLYETKHDYLKAEEYYSRAILAQPGDGEVLARYAKLIWELHGDEQRASAYFEQAVQASPSDCHVLAAYASFLWNSNTDGEEEKDQEPSNFSCSPHAHGIVGPARATVA